MQSKNDTSVFGEQADRGCILSAVSIPVFPAIAIVLTDLAAYGVA
jgi:hypothetical protein